MIQGNSYMFVCMEGYKIRAIYDSAVPVGSGYFIKVNTLTYDNRVEDDPVFINPQQIIKIYHIDV